MFDFHISIKNPFTKGSQKHLKDIIYNLFILSKNKRLEIQFSYYTNPYFIALVELDINPIRMDHGGYSFARWV